MSGGLLQDGIDGPESSIQYIPYKEFAVDAIHSDDIVDRTLSGGKKGSGESGGRGRGSGDKKV